MTKLAGELSDVGETVYLNKQINTALGKKIEGIGRWKPDVLSINKNGTITIIEVVSPSQTFQQMTSKVSFMQNLLERAGYRVNSEVILPSY